MSADGDAARGDGGAPRWFVAVAAPPVVRDRVARAVAPHRETARLRWTPPEGWHLTLAFLGRLADPGPAAEAVRAAARSTPPFTLVTAAPGRFGSRVLWLGVDDPDRALTALAVRVRAALAARDVEVADSDRPFTAHLTLARSRSSRAVTAADAARLQVAPVPWPVTELGLWSSRAAGGYLVDHAEPLRGQDDRPPR